MPQFRNFRWLATVRRGIGRSMVCHPIRLVGYPIILGLALLSAAPAWAQFPSQSSVPPPFLSQQALSCTSTSGNLSFSTWPPPLGYVTIWSNPGSQTYVYICEAGGTCSTSNGIALAVGQTLTFYAIPTTRPTCITDGATSATVIGRE